jgi:hypothetical protein
MRVVSLACIGLMVVTACGSSGDGPEVRDNLTIAEAKARLQKIVLDTAEAAGPGLPHPVFEDIGPTGCEDTETSPHVFSTWSVDVVLEDGRQPAELLPAVEAHWKDRGYDIDRHRMEDPEPELIGHTQGFAVTALAVPDSGRLNIGGDTPCVPNPELEEK